MAEFGSRSREKLATCHPIIQEVLHEAIKIIDFSVLEGHRTNEKQWEYYKKGKSKLDGFKNKSKHQASPSLAVDIAPYPIDFSDNTKAKARFYHLMGVIKAVAYSKNVILLFGLDWDNDDNYEDQSFDDLPHIQLVL